MNKGRVALLVVAALVFIAVGFVLGQVVQAVNVNNLGSDKDPVVTKSYVEKLVGERTALLQTEIDELEAELASVKGTGSADGGGSDANASGDAGSNAIVGQVEVQQESVNIRAEANTSSDKVAFATKGTKLDYTAEQGGWYRVILQNDKVGWVKSDLVEEVN